MREGVIRGERVPSGEAGCHQGVTAHRAVSGPPGCVSELMIPENLSDIRQRTNIQPDEEEQRGHPIIILHGLCVPSEGLTKSTNQISHPK